MYKDSDPDWCPGILLDPAFELQSSELKDLLMSHYRSTIVSDRSVLQQQMEAMSEIAAPFLRQQPIHICSYIESTVLLMQYNLCLKSQLLVPDILTQLHRKMEMLGFFYPTFWADMNLEIAYQLEKSGQESEATKLRHHVVSTMQKLCSRAQAIVDNCVRLTDRGS